MTHYSVFKTQNVRCCALTQNKHCRHHYN